MRREGAGRGGAPGGGADSGGGSGSGLLQAAPGGLIGRLLQGTDGDEPEGGGEGDEPAEDADDDFPPEADDAPPGGGRGGLSRDRDDEPDDRSRAFDEGPEHGQQPDDRSRSLDEGPEHGQQAPPPGKCDGDAGAAWVDEPLPGDDGFRDSDPRAGGDEEGKDAGDFQDPTSMSVRGLKQFLAARGVEIPVGITERGELEELCRRMAHLPAKRSRDPRGGGAAAGEKDGRRRRHRRSSAPAAAAGGGTPPPGALPAGPGGSGAAPGQPPPQQGFHPGAYPQTGYPQWDGTDGRHSQTAADGRHWGGAPGHYGGHPGWGPHQPPPGAWDFRQPPGFGYPPPYGYGYPPPGYPHPAGAPHQSREEAGRRVEAPPQTREEAMLRAEERLAVSKPSEEVQDAIKRFARDHSLGGEAELGLRLLSSEHVYSLLGSGADGSEARRRIREDNDPNEALFRELHRFDPEVEAIVRVLRAGGSKERREKDRDAKGHKPRHHPAGGGGAGVEADGGRRRSRSRSRRRSRRDGREEEDAGAADRHRRHRHHGAGDGHRHNSFSNVLTSAGGASAGGAPGRSPQSGSGPHQRNGDRGESRHGHGASGAGGRHAAPGHRSAGDRSRRRSSGREAALPPSGTSRGGVWGDPGVAGRCPAGGSAGDAAVGRAGVWGDAAGAAGEAPPRSAAAGGGSGGDDDFERWVMGLDGGHGAMSRYLEPLRREFGGDLRALAATVLPAPTSNSVVGWIEPSLWEALGIEALGHKLTIAKGVVALAKSLDADAAAAGGR